MNYHIAIISARRPNNVPKVQAITGEDVTWYVAAGEAADYKMHGAKNVVEAGGLCRARNQALDDAFAQGKVCVELSDDFAGVKWYAEVAGKKTGMSADFRSTLMYMESELNKTPYMLAGVAPTPNAFYYHSEFSTNLFIVGDFIMVKPTELRFDENMRLKEDYDFTVQHIKAYGGVLRANKVLATFAHRKNAGGAVDYRTSQLEQHTIEYLMAKWPGKFRMNPRRKDEILLIKNSKS